MDTLDMVRLLLVSMIFGGLAGGSIFRLVFVRDKTNEMSLTAQAMGVLAGGFVGGFAGMMMGISYPVFGVWPWNYWSATVLAAIFTVGFLKFIRDHLGSEGD